MIGGGTTTIAFSTVSGNTASSAGGGIENGGTLVLKQSTVAGNAAASGGGVDDTGSVTMTNTTISSNSASSGGGGIRVSQGRVTANNATIAFNVANSDADTTGHGGGIDDSAGGTVSLANTIVADNVDRSSSSRSPDCVGTMTSLGYDLLKTVAGCTTTGSTIGDVLDKDPQLGPLQKNGGSTPTHALLVNVKWRGKRPILVATPPLDAGSPGGATACAPTDQRGVRRPIGKRCDIGAYEYVPPTAPN